MSFMDLCTGSLDICLDCTRPKSIPRIQIKIPISNKLCPEIPPRKETVVRSGILSEASLANTGTEANIRDAAAADVFNIFMFFLRIKINESGLERPSKKFSALQIYFT